MSYEIQGRTGPTTNVDTNLGTPRLGAHGESIVNQLGGKYYEETRRGNVYVHQTAVAGVVIPIYSSVTPLFNIWNVSAGSHNVVPIKLQISLEATATPQIQGPFVFALITAGVVIAVPISAFTDVDIISMKTLQACRNAQVRCSLTATVAAPTRFLQLPYANPGVFATATATVPLQCLDYDFDGTMIIPPGMCCSLAGIVSPCTHEYNVALYFAVVPVQPGI